MSTGYWLSSVLFIHLLKPTRKHFSSAEVAGRVRSAARGAEVKVQWVKGLATVRRTGSPVMLALGWGGGQVPELHGQMGELQVRV